MENNQIKIRIKDIAKQANVSIGTVDRVIHNRGEVSAKTREKILSIIKELNYEPDILASTLALKKTIRMAALIPAHDNVNKFWKLPQAGLDKAIDEIKHFGVHLDKFTFQLFDSNSFMDCTHELLESNPDGVIIAPVFHKEAIDICKKITNMNIPFVFINSVLHDQPYLSFVGQNSYQSGVVAAKLMNFGLHVDDSVLVINVVKENGAHSHINAREKGFCTYFSEQNHIDKRKISRLTVNDADYDGIEPVLTDFFSKQGQPAGVFVTNSRVYKIAKYFQKEKSLNKTVLIGYDLLDENKSYLENGTINFLISQKPEDQGYRSITTLFNHLVLKRKVEKDQFLPIDIITRENIEYYH